MRRKVPSVGTPIPVRAALAGRRFSDPCRHFREWLGRMTSRSHCALTGSGTAALFVILRALRRVAGGERDQVVMPSYTAPSLVMALREAGTVPKLVDMSLETFNQDRDAMSDAVDGRTLAVMPVHMFGLPDDLRGLEEAAREKGAFVVEDGASAMGSRVGDRQVGSMGDVSFFSFNRGKNLSTVTGGAVLTDRADIFEAVTEEVDRLESPEGTAGAKIHLLVKALGLSLIWRPAAYTILSPLAGAYRYRGLHDRIELHTYTEYQAGIGCSLIHRADEIFTARHRKGTMLRDMLGKCRHLRSAELVPGAYAVYNQFPVIVAGKARRHLLNELLRAGIEATTLYPRPIHHVYDLGLPENPDPCPAATAMAEGILLIPVHPGVRESDLCRVAEIVRDGTRAERT